MNKKLLKAMRIENEYLQYRMKGEEPFHLVDRITELGYNSLDEYFTEKKEHKFKQWKPEIFRIETERLSEVLEDAIINGKYGIYTPIADKKYAFHGNDEIDYDLCESLDIRVIEMNYRGGTIIGSDEDFSVEIIAPVEIGLESGTIIKKMHEIVSKYIDNVTISGNDLLVDDEKVMGSMSRSVGHTFVWAAQFTFGDYADDIEKVCNKKSKKKPSKIKSEHLTKNKLEKEVFKWLQKL